MLHFQSWSSRDGAPGRGPNRGHREQVALIEAEAIVARIAAKEGWGESVWYGQGGDMGAFIIMNMMINANMVILGDFG